MGHSTFNRLARDYLDRKLTRRQFVAISAALGVSLSSVAGVIGSCAPNGESTAREAKTPEEIVAAAMTPATTWQAAPPPPSEPTGEFRFLSAENLTGNWDPSSHTCLAQFRFQKMPFDKLYDAKCDPQNVEELAPNLAVKWERTNDHTIRYHLKPDVKFHNGEPFTAADVKASLEYQSQPDKPTFGLFPDVLNCTVVDALTVDVSTPTPAGSLLFSLAASSILSHKDIERGPDHLATSINGTGPFRLVRQEGNATILEAYDDYHRGRPKLKRLVWEWVSEADVRLEALQTGAADAIDRVEVEQVAVINNTPNCAVQDTISSENKWLHFRCGKLPFRHNEKLRQALCHAIDKDGIIDNVFQGYAGKAHSHISPAMFGYARTPNEIEFDLQKAKRLLAESGHPGGRGLPELEFITSKGFYPKTKDYAEYIIQTIRSLGLSVRLRVLDAQTWNNSLYNGNDGHMIDSGWLPDAPEPDIVLRMLFHSSTHRITFVQEPELDEVLDAERNEVDLDRRRQLLQAWTLPKLMQSVPSYPLLVSVLIHGYRTNVYNFRVWPSTLLFSHQLYKT